MSTFYGGPQLSSITSVSGSQGSGTVYTVPSGFFAVISGTVQPITVPGFGARGGLNISGREFAVVGDSGGSPLIFSETTLPSGTTIGRFNTAGGGGAACAYDYYIGIQLYKNP